MEKRLDKSWVVKQPCPNCRNATLEPRARKLPNGEPDIFLRCSDCGKAFNVRLTPAGFMEES